MSSSTYQGFAILSSSIGDYEIERDENKFHKEYVQKEFVDVTKRLKRKPTYFSRWMNFDNIIWWFKIKVIYLSNE